MLRAACGDGRRRPLNTLLCPRARSPPQGLFSCLFWGQIGVQARKQGYF